MKQCLCLILLFILNKGIYAQPPGRISELSVGDVMPDIAINNIANYPKNSATLSELQGGKLMIIEFFASYCGTCLGFAPKIDSLQQQFKDELQVLQVTFESQKTIEAAKQKVAVLKNSSLPVVTGDTLLRKYFNYRYVPHNVWLDGSGKVVAITAHDEVTAANIKAMLASGVSGLKRKKDNLSFNYRKPFRPEDSLVRRRSTFTGYNAGIGGGHIFDLKITDSISRFFAWNATALNLLYTAFIESGVGQPNFKRIELQVKDSSRLFFPPKLLEPAGRIGFNEWVEKNLYCYELLSSERMHKKDFFAVMMNDLAPALNVQVKIVRRKVPTWVITRSKKGIPVGQVPEQTDTATGKKNDRWQMTVARLVQGLGTYPGTEPFADETGLTTPLNFEDNLQLNPDGPINIQRLQKMLSDQGLDIQLKKRWQNVLVISDK